MNYDASMFLFLFSLWMYVPSNNLHLAYQSDRWMGALGACNLKQFCYWMEGMACFKVLFSVAGLISNKYRQQTIGACL